jgi:hypothetical protein
MNTVIDSSSWTGGSSEPRDPYAVLTPEERKGTLQWSGSRRVFRVGVIGLPFLLALGFLFVGLEVGDYHAKGWRSEILNIPLLKVAVGFLFIALAWLGFHTWRQRLSLQNKIVPFVINDQEIRLGTPQRRIPIATVRGAFSKFCQESLPELAYSFSYYASLSRADRFARALMRDSKPAAARFLTISLTIDGEAQPLELDLAMLAGYPPRIGLIICDRVQKHQSLAGTKNA